MDKISELAEKEEKLKQYVNRKLNDQLEAKAKLLEEDLFPDNENQERKKSGELKNNEEDDRKDEKSEDEENEENEENSNQKAFQNSINNENKFNLEEDIKDDFSSTNNKYT